MPEDIRYYDLTDTDLVTRLALVHQRSTNTFPSWELAQPFATCVTTEKSTPYAET
jgi:glutamate synthase (ferredoxin)